MVIKGQWVGLTYYVTKYLTGLRLIPLGVKEEQYRRPRWLGEYIYSNLNSETLTIAAMSVMKCIRALYYLLR